MSRPSSTTSRGARHQERPRSRGLHLIGNDYRNPRASRLPGYAFSIRRRLRVPGARAKLPVLRVSASGSAVEWINHPGPPFRCPAIVFRCFICRPPQAAEEAVLPSGPGKALRVAAQVICPSLGVVYGMSAGHITVHRHPISCAPYRTFPWPASSSGSPKTVTFT